MSDKKMSAAMQSQSHDNYMRMNIIKNCPTQAVLPLVGLAADKVIRDRYGWSKESWRSRQIALPAVKGRALFRWLGCHRFVKSLTPWTMETS
ncbi:MAG: hypothetical protein ACQESR_19770 [Planctomycetota bacterium]